jgi:predicted dehydrogenase
MTPLRLAVIGAGHLGKIHARLAAQLPEFTLAAVVDPHPAARQAAAEALGVPARDDHRALLGEIDAAVVAAPTSLHFDIAADLMRGGVHVLVEKPLAADPEQTAELVRLARRRELVLQTGHVERFNPALLSVEGRLQAPRFIEARRLSGYTFRSTDVGVVYDLMIHDIDICLALVKSPVVAVDALGAAVIGRHEDMASARLKFACGAVAQLTASRTSFRQERVMNVYGPRVFASLDFAERQATVVEPHATLVDRSFRQDRLDAAEQARLREHLFDELLVKQTLPRVELNAIEEELRDFARAIHTGCPPRVTGAAGHDAVAVAHKVLEAVREHAWDAEGLRRGPLAMPRDLQAADLPIGDQDTVVLRTRAA